jgi:ribose transport system substrate-binding protein
VTIVGEQPGDWTNSVAMQVTENMLQANKDVQGLFTASDVMLDGILEALSDGNRKGMTIISVDGSHKAVDLLATGQISGTMAQFPQKIGSLAVENLVLVIEKKSEANSIPKIIDSGTTMYSKDNLDEARKQMF